MNMLSEFFVLVLKIWAIIAFARFFLQKAGMHVSHPIAIFCKNLTDFAVIRARKIIKPVWGWDYSILFIISISFFLLHSLIFLVTIFNYKELSLFPIMFYLISRTFLDISYVICFTFFVFIFSYLYLLISQSNNPLIHVLDNILYPFFKFFMSIKIKNKYFVLFFLLIFVLFWIYFGFDYFRILLVNYIEMWYK